MLTSTRYLLGELLRRCKQRRLPVARRRRRFRSTTEQLECRILPTTLPVVATLDYQVETNATLNGTVTDDGPVSGLTVELDTDGNGTVDEIGVTNANGNFTFNIDPVSGETTVYARAVDVEGDGAWKSLTFTPENLPASVAELGLTNDTGVSNSDGITTDATVDGTIWNDGPVGNMMVEIDLDGDGVANDYTVTDSSGHFSYDATSQLPFGNVTVSARTVEWDVITNSELVSDWVSLSFVLENPNQPAVISSLGLLNDTGASDSDGVTTDATIAGTITNDGSVEGIMIEIDVDGDGYADYYTVTDSSGAFSIDLTPYLSPGNNTVQVRTLEYDTMGNPIKGEWSLLSFVLEA